MGSFEVISLTIPLFQDSACNKEKLGIIAIADGFLTHELSIWQAYADSAARRHNAKGKSKYCFRLDTAEKQV
jgi:hypothetical protein